MSTLVLSGNFALKFDPKEVTMTLIKLPEVLKLIPVCKSTWYTLLKEQGAPKTHRIGKRAVAWVKEDIEQWLANRQY